MQAAVLNAQVREISTKSALKGMRTRGQIPATIYGKNIQSVSIAVGEKEIGSLLKTNRHGVIEVEVQSGGKHPVIINDIQKHKLSGRMLHIDFHAINMKEPITTLVSMDFTGKAKGVEEGGLLQISKHEIEIKCLPDQIPGQIQADITHLGLGDNLTAAQIKLPEGIELRSDPSEVLVTILVPQKDVEKAEEVEGGEENKSSDEAAE